MIKIGILTHYGVNNQGAQLQMYALNQFLKDLGYDVYIYTYKKNYDFDTNNWEKRNEITIKSTCYILKEFVLKKGIRLTWHNIKKYIKNKKFREKNFKFAQYAKFHTDVAIIGSDEVLSLQVGPNIMMYGHAVNTNHFIAYAPCNGGITLEEIKEKQCMELISSGLKKFDALSARDECTQNMIINLTGRKDVPLVCDPVLLYDFSNTSVKFKKIKKKYIIVYSYDRNFTDKHEIEVIKKYANKKGLKLASVGTYHKWCDYNISCNALEWIEYFRNAEEVITNTYHGTILSIITNKPMAVIAKTEKTKSILSYLKLEKRIMKSIDNLTKVMDGKIDFNLVNKSWYDYRKKSGDFLIENLRKVYK